MKIVCKDARKRKGVLTPTDRFRWMTLLKCIIVEASFVIRASPSLYVVVWILKGISTALVGKLSIVFFDKLSINCAILTNINVPV